MKVEKRPLLHPPIASPYRGHKSTKVVYVSSKTPFMSAVKRVKQLLKHIDKRVMQSVLSSKGPARKDVQGLESKINENPEEVLIKATGKAIDKALNLALFFQAQQDCIVRITTGSVDAIDDLVSNPAQSEAAGELHDDIEAHETLKAEVEESDIDLPDARIRHVSFVEVHVSLRL